MEVGGSMVISMRALISILVLIFTAAGSVRLGIWISEKNREVADTESAGQFSYLKSLIESYYDEHGHFPPTKYQSQPGGPFHSWRVLLIPYTTTKWINAYSKYDFSKEWNSDVNGFLGKCSPSCFRIEGDNSQYAQYLALGENDTWPSKYGLKTHVIKRNGEHFILIECRDSKVIWTSPEY